MKLRAAGKDFNDMATAFRGPAGRGAERRAAYQRGVRAGCLVEPADFGQQRLAKRFRVSMAAAIEETTVSIDHIAKNAQDAQDYSRRSDEVAAEGGAASCSPSSRKSGYRADREPVGCGCRGAGPAVR